jgi:hypothetical protein
MPPPPHDTHTDRTQRHCWRESLSMHASQGRLSSRGSVRRECRAPGLDASASRRQAKRAAVQPWMTIIFLAEISFSTCQSNCAAGQYAQNAVCSSTAGNAPSCTVTFSGLAGRSRFITIDLQNSDFDSEDEYISSLTVGSQSMSFSNNYRYADCSRTSRIMDSVSVPSSEISGDQMTVTIQTSYEVNILCNGQTLYAVVILCTACPAGESEIAGTRMYVCECGGKPSVYVYPYRREHVG